MHSEDFYRIPGPRFSLGWGYTQGRGAVLMSDLVKMVFPAPGLAESAPAGQLLELNNYSRKYGLQLSRRDADLIVAARNNSLQRQGRIELSNQPLVDIVRTFCSSPHIGQAEYVDIISELVEVFYCIKNESREEIPDDELIAAMKTFYDGICQGSLDLMAGRELERLAREVRTGMSPGAGRDTIAGIRGDDEVY